MFPSWNCYSRHPAVREGRVSRHNDGRSSRSQQESPGTVKTRKWRIKTFMSNANTGITSLHDQITFMNHFCCIMLMILTYFLRDVWHGLSGVVISDKKKRETFVYINDFW